MTWGIQPAADVCMAVRVGHKRLDWCTSKAAGLNSGSNMSLVGPARSALAGRTQTAGVTTSEAHSSEIFRRS